MVVLVALTAALYAGLTLPCKVLTLVPGFTEVRPTVVIPVLMGIACGPAGAWGAAIGNIIGDLMSGFVGPLMAFGAAANLFFGFAAYKLSRTSKGELREGLASTDDTLSPGYVRDMVFGIVGLVLAGLTVIAVALQTWSPPGPASLSSAKLAAHYAAHVFLIALGLLIASLALRPRVCVGTVRVLPLALGCAGVCAGILGWGAELLEAIPFVPFALIILLNNTFAVVVLLPLLLPAILPRMRAWGLLTNDILRADEVTRPMAPRLGRLLMWASLIGIFAVGVAPYFGDFTILAVNAKHVIALAQTPFVATLLVGLWLA